MSKSVHNIKHIWAEMMQFWSIFVIGFEHKVCQSRPTESTMAEPKCRIFADSGRHACQSRSTKSFMFYLKTPCWFIFLMPGVSKSVKKPNRWFISELKWPNFNLFWRPNRHHSCQTRLAKRTIGTYKWALSFWKNKIDFAKHQKCFPKCQVT